MKPKEFLIDIVEPTLAEAEREPFDIRRSILAIAAIDMLAAHIFHSRSPDTIIWDSNDRRDDTGFRSVLARISRDFEIVRDIAKAQKHVKLTQGKPKVSNADSVVSAALGYGRGAFNEGPYSGKQIVVNLEDSTRRNVISVMKTAVAFLRLEMRNP